MQSKPTTQLFLAAGLALLPTVVASDQIKLRSVDGFTEVDGEILSFDDVAITLATSVGTINIPTSSVECFGAACPEGIARGKSVISQTLAIESKRMRDAFTALLDSQSQKTDSALRVTWRSTEEFALNIISNPQVSAQVTLMEWEQEALGPKVVSVAATNPLENEGGEAHHLLAAQAFSVVVAPNTGMTSITHEQLAQIYAGQYLNWSELGGADILMQPLRPAPDGLEFGDLVSMVLDPFGLEMASDILTVPDSAAAVAFADQISGSVAVVNSAAVKESSSQLSVLGACGIPVPASEYTITSGAYPLTLATYGFLDSAGRDGLLGALFEHIAKPDHQSVMAANGYTNLSIKTRPLQTKAARATRILAGDLPPTERQRALNLIAATLDAQQLSVSFEGGQSGAPATDAFQRANFIRLAAAIEAGEFDGGELLFLGFAQGANQAESLAQSRQAAERLVAAFEAFSPVSSRRPEVSFSAEGFGTLSDLDCLSFNGTEQTSRVEIWVRPAAG